MGDVFKTKADMPAEAGVRNEPSFTEFPRETGPKNMNGSPVRTILTPADQRAVGISNYPRFSEMDVHHVARPRFGHSY